MFPKRVLLTESFWLRKLITDPHILADVNMACLDEKYQKSDVHGSVHRKYIPTYIQKDATLHSLLYLETALHVSGVTSTHHQERIQLYLQHPVFFTPLLLPAAISGD
jgi:hypothetical protein